MIKLGSITLTVLLVTWLCVAARNQHNDMMLSALALGTAVWIAVFGSYIGWHLLLAMVRQLGAAMRGK